jgi:hypothetical protein
MVMNNVVTFNCYDYEKHTKGGPVTLFITSIEFNATNVILFQGDLWRDGIVKFNRRNYEEMTGAVFEYGRYSFACFESDEVIIHKDEETLEIIDKIKKEKEKESLKYVEQDPYGEENWEEEDDDYDDDIEDDDYDEANLYVFEGY